MVNKVIMPKLGETMEEGEIIKWLKKEGEKVEKGEPLLEIATDKANMEVEATASGYLRKVLAKEGEKVSVTTEIAYIAGSMDEEIPSGEKEEKESKAPSAQKEVEEKEKPPIERGRIKASPLARRVAREKDIDLKGVKGTGPGGRIVKEDVLKAAEAMVTEAKPSPEAEKTEEVPSEAQQITPTRTEKIMAQRMQQSKKEVPHFYLTSEVDFSEGAKLRKDLNEEFEKEKGVRISFTDFLIKACGKALRKFPRTNSHYREGKIISLPGVNVGLAVARQQGLVVPVIKDADKKNLFEIAQERQNLVSRVAENKLSLEEMEGGTFTLSNLGMMQIKNFTAIINPPQVCLLATGQIKQQPVVGDEGKIGVAPIMQMTLSCDHRAVDGYLGSQFLQEVKRSLEKPMLLMV